MAGYNFILDEAEVDDNAEDDEDELEEGFEQLIHKDYNEEEEGDGESFRNQRQLDHLLEMQEEDKLEEYYRLVQFIMPLFIKHL